MGHIDRQVSQRATVQIDIDITLGRQRDIGSADIQRLSGCRADGAAVAAHAVQCYRSGVDLVACRTQYLVAGQSDAVVRGHGEAVCQDGLAADVSSQVQRIGAAGIGRRHRKAGAGIGGIKALSGVGAVRQHIAVETGRTAGAIQNKVVQRPDQA